MKKAVIFTGLVKVDKNLVGTAVIYQKIADILLRQGYAVGMVVPEQNNLKNKINYYTWSEKNNKKLINSSDLVIFGAYPPVEPMYYAYQKKKTIITYLWSIAPVGSLEFKDFASINKQRGLHYYINASYNLSLLLSDKIFCRNERVRNLVLGSLLALGRVDLKNYQGDKTLRNLIDTAPFGIEARAPKHKKNIYRGVIKGIKDDDFLLIWNGGVWNWNDGETLIKTMKLIREKYNKKNIKLILQGFKHPDENQKLSQEAQRTLDLIEKYELEDKNIFIAHWLAFKERENYLTECDAGIVTAPNIPEANFFLKTRIYDYLWADLPVVLGDNEAFAPFINQMKLGLVAKCGTPQDFTKKIIALEKSSAMRAGIKNNIKTIKKNLNWNKTLEKVKEYFKNPEKDKLKYVSGRSLYRENIKNNLNIINK
ncbi:MAG: glycosyltransferase [Patescibacteria group bacterium]|nr:glycosyltransferase [Patescibacteria group bacterium]